MALKIVTGVLAVAAAMQAAHAKPVIVFAAASTRQVVEEIAAAWTASRGERLGMVFASSGALARQIERGAPANVFISANGAWIDYLVSKNEVNPSFRRALFGNRLALVAPRDARAGKPDGDAILARLGSRGRLAIADPRHAPAGIYARQALASIGIWKSVAPRTARTRDVRSALALVERGEALLGIVYRTDASASGAARILTVFDAGLHDPIVYHAAPITRENRSVPRLLDFLSSPSAKEIYLRHGFVVD